MEKFNLQKANQIVTKHCQQQIDARSLLLFAPTGSLPYVMARQCLDDNSNYDLFMKAIRKELIATFNYTPTLVKYLNGYNIQTIWKQMGIRVGGCDIKYDGKTGEGTFTLIVGNLDSPIQDREVYPFTFNLEVLK